MSMTKEEMEAKLTYLMDRQEIYDVVVRYCRGCDRLDKDMVMSAYHPDALDDHGSFVGPPDAFWDWVKNLHGKYQSATQHMIGNQYVEIDGETAHCETYLSYSAMNTTGAPFSAIGGRYIDRMEKRGGKWAIAHRKYVVDWVAPSINTIEGSKTPEGAPNFDCIAPHEFAVAETGQQTSRDTDDPSYERPLVVDPARVEHYERLTSSARETAR